MRTCHVALAASVLCVAAACGGAAPPTQPASTETTAATTDAGAAPQATGPYAEPETAPAPRPADPQHRASQPPAPRPAAQETAAPRTTATAHVPPSPPKPEMVELPAGTVIEMELAGDLSSKLSKQGDPFTAKVIDPVTMGGVEVIPAGSTVHGTVTQAVSAKQMSGQAVLSLAFTQVTLPDGNEVAISASLTEKGKKIGKRTAGIVGGSAAGGAVLGRIIGKDTKGAVVGALLGAAAGTGIAASQKGQELKLPAGTGLAIEIDSPVRVPVPPERM